VRLLTDIRRLFDGKGNRIATADLLAALANDEEAPWGEWYGSRSPRVARADPVSGYVRDTNAETDDAEAGEIVPFPARSRWARLDSNQGPTDYESAALTS
jgi:hypothetical protein